MKLKLIQFIGPLDINHFREMLQNYSLLSFKKKTQNAVNHNKNQKNAYPSRSRAKTILLLYFSFRYCMEDDARMSGKVKPAAPIAHGDRFIEFNLGAVNDT